MDMVTDKGVQTLIEEFVCPICVQLVEAPVITACSHVFCAACWDEWMSQSRALSSSKCPKCNRIFTGVGASADSVPPIAELKTGNPLAHRISVEPIGLPSVDLDASNHTMLPRSISF